MRKLWLILLVLPLALFLGCDTGTDDGDGNGNGNGNGDGEDYTLAWALEVAADAITDLFNDPVPTALGANSLTDDGKIEADPEGSWFLYMMEDGFPDHDQYLVTVHRDGSVETEWMQLASGELPEYDDAEPWLTAAITEAEDREWEDHDHLSLFVYSDDGDVWPGAATIARVPFRAAGGDEIGRIYLDADTYDILE
ncbi:hypothetical protein KAU45_03110 [bacterium]|nr:hypothetical protein [bacterium]